MTLAAEVLSQADSAEQAEVLGSSEEALEVTASLLASLSADSAARDSEQRLPTEEVRTLAAAGVFAAGVPADFGGAAAPRSTIVEIVRLLATADPNIAQIPQSHFVFTELLRLVGTQEQQQRWWPRVLAGQLLANAQAERGGRTAGDLATTLTSETSSLLISGRKAYCTGSLFADVLAVVAVADQDAGLEKDGVLVALVDADAPGVEIRDDWDALGQRTTTSGTVLLDRVAVDAVDILSRDQAVFGDFGYGAFAQALHAAIDVGIARAALDEAVAWAREKARPFAGAGVDRAVDDPLLAHRVGEIEVAVRAAEAALVAAGKALDANADSPGSSSADAASTAVAVAKITADQSSIAATSGLYEVAGLSAAGPQAGLDRHWRNARTHTLHDPVRWTLHDLGAAVLRGEVRRSTQF